MTSVRSPRRSGKAASLRQLRLVGLAAAGGLAVLLGTAAALNPVLGLGAFIGLACLVGFVRSGALAVCVFAGVTYGDILTEYTGAALSPIKLAGGALILLAAITMVVRQRRGPAQVTVAPGAVVDADGPGWRSHPVTVALVAAFVAWALTSAAWATDLAQVKTLSTRLLTDALVFLAVPVFLRSTDHLRALGWTLLGCATAATGFGLVTGANLAGRSIGTFSDPNEFAAALVPAMAIGLPLAESSSSWLARWAGRAGVAICRPRGVPSGRRGGQLAKVVAVALVLAGARGRERVRLTGLTFLAIACGAAWLALTPAGSTVAARLSDHDSSGRAELWTVALREFRSEPLHGVGLGNYPVRSKYFIDGLANQDLFLRDARTTHSTPLELLAELGIIGLGLYYAFIAACIAAGVRATRIARRLGDLRLAAAARGMVAGILAAVAATLFLSNQYQEVTWVLCGACIAGLAVARRQAAVAEAEALLAVAAALDGESELLTGTPVLG
jgi:O-antigen ligase